MRKIVHSKHIHYVSKIVAILLASIVVAFVLNSLFIEHTASPIVGSGTTIGIVSDGDDVTPFRPNLMVKDLNHLISDLPEGWKLDASLWLGDIGYGNGVSLGHEAWKASDASTSPMFFVQGNHEADSNGDVDFLRNLFYTYPKDFNIKAAPLAHASTTNYSFDVGDVHVVVVNQYTSSTTDDNLNLGKYGGYIHPLVFEWVKDDLAQSTKVHNVVVGHEPMFPTKRHLGDSLDADVSNRNQFLNLLASYNVAAHLVGHTHVSKVEEMAYDYKAKKPSVLGGGVWELDAGAFGTKASGTEGDGYPSLGFFHANSATWGDYKLQLIQGKGFPSWSKNEIISKSQKDLEKIVLLNTWKGSGTATTQNGLTRMNYFVDYSNEVEKNPNWSFNNNGKWWQPKFDVQKAEWKEGELGVGYDVTKKYGWINTPIDPMKGASTPQVHSVMGRVEFTAPELTLYSKLQLDYDYVGGLMVWLNGKVIYNSLTVVPQSEKEYFDYRNAPMVKTNTTSHEIPVFVSSDISEYKRVLKVGKNVLTYWNTNGEINSETLAAALRLSLVK